VSNPLAREPFRHTDLVGGACVGIIAGLGAHGYLLALDAAKQLGGRGSV
jgi:3-dehydroquinate dehydratase II